jgi:hypothetical protein
VSSPDILLASAGEIALLIQAQNTYRVQQIYLEYIYDFHSKHFGPFSVSDIINKTVQNIEL